MRHGSMIKVMDGNNPLGYVYIDITRIMAINPSTDTYCTITTDNHLLYGIDMSAEEVLELRQKAIYDNMFDRVVTQELMSNKTMRIFNVFKIQHFTVEPTRSV